MSSPIEIKVPDLGDFAEVEVIEVLVSEGQQVAAEDSLITLESDKATMEIPTPNAGVVTKLLAQVGQKVAQGTVIALLDSDGGGDSVAKEEAKSESETEAAPAEPTAPVAQPEPAAPVAQHEPTKQAEPAASTAPPSDIEIKVPDIGDFDEVEIIEVLVSEGQQVAAEDSLVTLESDKATMEIPTPNDGVISKLLAKVGQKVSQGTVIAILKSSGGGGGGSTDDSAATAPPTPTQEQVPAQSPAATTSDTHQPPPTLPPVVEQTDGELPHASPAIRRFARELGAQLSRIKGSGTKGRILKQDVKNWVKHQLTASPQSRAAQGGSGIPPIPPVDFSQFGDVEVVPLSRIKKLSGPHLQRAWLNIPHVTHHDEADITELEEFRQSLKSEAEKEGIRVTVLGFVVKILAQALKKFPSFNASLDPDGESLVVKKYFNVGIAVDTPNGLVVPVINQVDRKTIFELAREMGDLSERARQGKLKPEEMRGGCITISSLGGIGGSSFTPIVNAPEVAILGITRARMQPVWTGKEFEPRLMLPLDLSYDHRVVDGAEAARFVAFLIQSFADARRIAL